MARRGASEHILQDDGADVSENYTSTDDEWNRITHWTLHEFEPYKSYSYHYHNIKHPKKRFWDFWKICKSTIIWEFKTTYSIFDVFDLNQINSFTKYNSNDLLIWVISSAVKSSLRTSTTFRSLNKSIVMLFQADLSCQVHNGITSWLFVVL